MMGDDRLLLAVTVLLGVEWVLLLLVEPPVAVFAAGVWMVGQVRRRTPA